MTRNVWTAEWELVERLGWTAKCGYDGPNVVYRVERGTTEFIEIRGTNASRVKARLLYNLIFKEQE